MTTVPPSTLHTSSIASLHLLARGKVRDNYAVGEDRILMVASDRLSAFDVILGQPIPGKGALLTQMGNGGRPDTRQAGHQTIRHRCACAIEAGEPLLHADRDFVALARIDNRLQLL